MIKITSLNKIYKSKKRKRCFALNDINLTLPDEGLVFVLGKSGSGKSTLLNLIGGLDSVTSGSIEVDGNDLAKFKEKDFCNYRNTHIGFIFQDYHLIDELTVYDNIALSLNLLREDDREKVLSALARVDLAGYEDRYPTELSGGEQQRVAIARAIVKKPRIILADEPTGNLDTNTARAVIELLKELSRECLILIVSHNINDANNYADRIIELKKGAVISDKSRNPDFPDDVILTEREVVYPDGTILSDRDIDLLNDNITKKIVKRTDKFLPTGDENKASRSVAIQNKNLTFAKETRLSGKFLKNKVFSISASAFMVAVIMVIMALAQTIIAFEGSEIVSAEMGKSNQNALLLNKTLDEETQTRLDGNYRVKIDEDDIQTFYDAGYEGKIYPILNVTLPITSHYNYSALTSSCIGSNTYMRETFGTMIVDEGFLRDKFGEVKFVVQMEDPPSTGIYITDYVADSILNCSILNRNKTYGDLLGEHYRLNWGVSTNIIAGIIETGYKERYADLYTKMANGEFENTASLYNEADFIALTNEIYEKLGYCYSWNPDFAEEYQAWTSKKILIRQRLVVNDVFDIVGENGFVNFLVYKENGDNTSEGMITIPIDEYNKIFGTDYTVETASSFVPHKIKIVQYAYADVDKRNPLFEADVTVTALTDITWCINSAASELFSSVQVYYNALYFDGTDGIDTVLDTAKKNNYQPQSVTIDGVYTMTRAVDVFVPIFELIAIFLCAAVVFILVNFSTKMIRDKMHEIGILKALGTKNSTVFAVFGLQVALIALLTCVLSTVGYYFFIDFANDVLFESLKQLAQSQVVLDLEFLTFRPEIALTNCALIAFLAVVSMVIPMLKIKAIKPVKIIKAKE